MRAWLIARKSLLEILREPQLLLLELALPFIFVGITAVTYTAPLQVTYGVWVMGADANAALVEELKAQRYPDGAPVFEITYTTDRAAAQAALKDRKATALLALETGVAGQLAATIVGDALYPRFHRASTLLDAAVNRYADRVAGRPQVMQVEASALVAAGPRTEFDLYAPGMMIFALLMLIPQTAMLVAREMRWKTLRRLRLTRMRAIDLLAGVSLAQLVVAATQVVIVFLTALAMGFHNQGSLAVALLVGLVMSFSAIGQGLIVACFSKNDSEAANVGSTLTMLQVFLSGAFFQLPPITMFTLADHQIDLFDVFPATHGFMALQHVLSYGFGLREIGFRLLATALLSGLYFVAGVFVFHRLQMQRKE